MRIRKRQQRAHGASSAAAAPNTSDNLPVISSPAGRVEESGVIEPLNGSQGVQEQVVVRESAEQEIQALDEVPKDTMHDSSRTGAGESQSTRSGSFTWLDKLWHTKGFQPAEPHVGLDEYLSSWNVSQKSISSAGESESGSLAPASSAFSLPISPKGEHGLLKQREEFVHGEEMPAGCMIIGEKQPAIANPPIKDSRVLSGLPVPHAGSAIERYNSCASGTDSTPTIIATSDRGENQLRSSTAPAMISLTGSSVSDVNLGGDASLARDSDVDHRLRSDASLPKPVSVQRSVEDSPDDIGIEARTQGASIQVPLESQLAMEKADPRLEDAVAFADLAGSSQVRKNTMTRQRPSSTSPDSSEEARSGRGLTGRIVGRSSGSSDDPGKGIVHQHVEERGVETLQACIASRYEPTKMTAIETWQANILAVAAPSDLAIAREDSTLIMSRNAGRIVSQRTEHRLTGEINVQSTIAEEDADSVVAELASVAATASLFPNHPAQQPPKDILERSMHKVFFQAGKSGLTAREAVSKILEQGLAGMHEGGPVVSRMQVGKLLRSSPYFMEIEEGRFALCSAVIEVEDIQGYSSPHDPSSKLQKSHTDKAMPRAPKLMARHNKGPVIKERIVAPIDISDKEDRGEANVETAEVGSSPEDAVRLEPLEQESSMVGVEEVAQERRRKRLKTITQEGISGLGNQCNRTDGKGWVCPLRAKVGYQLCDHHLNRLNDKGKSKSEN